MALFHWLIFNTRAKILFIYTVAFFVAKSKLTKTLFVFIVHDGQKKFSKNIINLP